MKYSNEVIIDAPIEKVMRLFDDPTNLPKWMSGLQSFEHISGEPGQPGSKSKLVFQMGSRRTEMLETVMVRNLPEEFTGKYEAKGVDNIVRNRFIAIDDNHTKYISEQEFNLSGFMKVIAFLMPGAFKKQSMKFLTDFKKFVESES